METKLSRVTNLELFTFADGGVRLAHVTWEIIADGGERRCVAAHEFKPLCFGGDADDRQYDDDGGLVTDPNYRTGY